MTYTIAVSSKESDFASNALNHYLSWLSEILEQQVLASDNFLDVGGHSMIAISLNERVKKEFGLTLSMEKLYNVTLEDVFSTAK